ncbi:hypothetical protein TIFTF001_026323 [Ficus carica]|uniref:Uncharacterized protein n=1 Tax=Ficus carica TaxID=3494 RepID=A0AA88DL66_FICCA|nr:hypothetical protein TIFTF001_026323 [Ficus carica]
MFGGGSSGGEGGWEGSAMVKEEGHGLNGWGLVLNSAMAKEGGRAARAR